MARTALTPTVFTPGSESDLLAQLVAFNADGHSFQINPNLILFVLNSDAGSHTLTIQTPRTVEGMEIAERTVVIPAADLMVIHDFPAHVYSQPSAPGNVYIDIDDETSVTCLLVQLG